VLSELRGIDVYQGLFGPSHFELALLCMRSNRTMGAQRRVPEWRLDEWRAETTDHVTRQVAGPAERLLVSAEALSLLRYEDEVEVLAQLLSPRSLRVAVCIRDPVSFLQSYRREIQKNGDTPSRYRASHQYVEPDTWLVRWDDMLDVWRRVIGDEEVIAFNYEDVMGRFGSSIPGVLAALGIDPDGLPSWDGLTANVTRAPDPLTIKAARRLKRLRHHPGP